MHIDRTHGPSRGTRAAGPRTRQGQERFDLPPEAALPPVLCEEALPAGSILAVTCAATDSHPADAQDAAAAGHGEAVLQALAGLQVAALSGRGGQARASLAALAGAPKPAADPGLEELLQAIAARAAVELARHE